MTHFADLSPFVYGHAETTSLLNVGWLDASEPFPTGPNPRGFRRKLARLCATRHLNLTRGRHWGNLCPPEDRAGIVARCGVLSNALGSSEIRVTGKGTTYASPDLIVHYVADHGYRLPDEFVDAVLARWTCPLSFGWSVRRDASPPWSPGEPRPA